MTTRMMPSRLKLIMASPTCWLLPKIRWLRLGGGVAVAVGSGVLLGMGVRLGWKTVGRGVCSTGVGLDST